MPLSPMARATLQAAVLGALSNVLAQLLARRAARLDWAPVLHFMLFSAASTPPNFLWQEWLEAAFPARPRASPAPGRPPAPPRLSLRNTLAKFALDQTLGAAANTLLFSAYAHALRAAVRPAAPAASPLAAVRHLLRPGSVDLAAVDLAAVWAAVRRDFWPIVWAGMRFWPLVSLVNFALVSTLEARNLVAALAGIAWGVYMSLWAAS